MSRQRSEFENSVIGYLVLVGIVAVIALLAMAYKSHT